MLQVGNRFVGAALAAGMAVLAGCGGGDPEGAEPEAAAFLEDAADAEQAAEMQAAMEQAPAGAASCRPGRTCRLSGSIVDRGTGRFTTPGCSTLTTTSFGRAILNASLTGSLQRPGRYNVRVTSGSYRLDTTVSPLTCSVPGAGSITIPGDSSSRFLRPSTGTVLVVSDGSNLTVTGNLIGSAPPGCTGGNRFVGTVIGLSNPMVTLRGSMTCNVAGATFTVTSTVKMVGAF